MSHKQTPINEQLILVNNAVNSSQTFAEAMADWAGKLKGAERDEAIKQAAFVISQMDDMSFSTYQTRLSQLMGINSRELKRLITVTQKKIKEGGEDGQEVTYTMGGFVDGYLIEYLYDPEEQRVYLAWREPNGRIETGTSVIIDGKKYMPMPVSPSIISGGVLLPSKLGSTKSTRELALQIENFIRHAYLLPNVLDAKIISYYVLLTWLYDMFEAIPYLRATGEPGSGKSELMQRVGLVCYRRISANGAGTTSSLFRMIEKYQGTVFLDEMDLQKSDASADMVKLVNLGAMKGNPIIRCEEVLVDGVKQIQERMFQTYCPKLIAMQREFYDRAVATRCITFRVQPRETYELVNAGIPLNQTAEMKSQATALRNLLVRWRLEKWVPIMEVDPRFYDMDISARLNQVTGALLSIAQDDPSLQNEIRGFLREYYAELVQERSMTIAARLVEAIWTIMKFQDTDAYLKELIETEADGSKKILVGDVAKMADELINAMNGGEDAASESKGRDDKLSPHKTGKLLRSELQLRISGRTNKGFYVYWDEEHMKALAKRFGINLDEIGPRKTSQAPMPDAKTTPKAAPKPKQVELPGGDE
jgi:hypothetical protein